MIVTMLVLLIVLAILLLLLIIYYVLHRRNTRMGQKQAKSLSVSDGHDCHHVYDNPNCSTHNDYDEIGQNDKDKKNRDHSEENDLKENIPKDLEQNVLKEIHPEHNNLNEDDSTKNDLKENCSTIEEHRAKKEDDLREYKENMRRFIENMERKNKLKQEEVIEEFSLALEKKLSFYDNWLTQGLEECKQKVTKISWARVKDGCRVNYVAGIKLYDMKPSFFEHIDNFTQLELSSYDEKGATKWSAIGWLYEGNISMDLMRIEIKKFHDQSKIKYMSTTELNFGLFEIVNVDRRNIHHNKMVCLRDGIKKISTDPLLCKLILAINKNTFSTSKHLISLPMNWIDEQDDDFAQLEKKQLEAVKNALCNRVSLVMGPPGTGVTITLALMANNLFRTRLASNSKILICAPRNEAIDNIADEIYKSGKLDVVKINSESNIIRLQGIQKPYYLDKLLIDKIGADRYLLNLKKLNSTRTHSDTLNYTGLEELKTECEKKILNDCHVICCTCDTIPRLIRYGTHLFDSIIVNESNQVSVPDGLLLLQFLPRRIVFVGDSNQFTPVIKEIFMRKYSNSNIVLYNRLMSIGFRPTMLDTQYLIHPEIFKFSNEQFYSRKIIYKLAANDLKWKGFPYRNPFPNQEKPIYFHCHNIGNSRESSAFCFDSILNREELDIVFTTVEVLISRGIRRKQIGVIVSLQEHRQYLIDKIAPRDFDENIITNMPSDNFVEVDTIDAFQGRYKDYVIVSLVDSKKYIRPLADGNRLNVTLTRAKCGLIMIGNVSSLLLKSYYMFDELIRDFSGRGLLFSDLLSEKNKPIKLYLPNHNKAIGPKIV